MRLSTVFTACLTTLSVTAVPAAGDTSASGQIQLGEVDFPGFLELPGVQANGGFFWLDKPTSSICKDPKGGFDDFGKNDCNLGKNRTIFYGLTQESLALVTPGNFVNPKGEPKTFVYLAGQRVYVAPDGALAYTKPKQLYVAKGSIVSGWSYFFGTLVVDQKRLRGHVCDVNGFKKVYMLDPSKAGDCTYTPLSPEEPTGAKSYT